MCFDNNPQGGSTLSHRGDLEVSSGRTAAGGPSKDGIPLPEMEYRDLEGTIRFFSSQVRVYLIVFSIY